MYPHVRRMCLSVSTANNADKFNLPTPTRRLTRDMKTRKLENKISTAPPTKKQNQHSPTNNKKVPGTYTTTSVLTERPVVVLC